MSRTYNTLDMDKLAREFREKLILEIADVIAGFEYDLATGPYVTDDEFKDHDAYVAKIRRTLAALNDYIGEPVA